MRPYGERPKRRPGGNCNPCFKTWRESQRREIPPKYERLEYEPQDKNGQRNYAREMGNAEVRVDLAAMADEEEAPLSGSLGGDD